MSKQASLRKRLLSLDRATDKTEWQNTVNEIDRAQADLNEFTKSLWNNYRPYAQIKYPRPVSLEQSALGPRETAIIFDVADEGVMSMGRAFQYAGAESVLMSLWSVAEKSSVLLIESFFRNLKKGRDKITSLEMARKGLRDQGFEHPFFWAPSVLVGEMK